MREPANLVSPKARTMWLVSALLGWLFPLAAILGWAILAPGQRSWQLPIGLAVALLAVAHLAVMPQWRFRVHRWEVTDSAVYTQTGWIHLERRIAPISRIQTVDSEFGPLERLFGLGSVTVTTASAAGALKVSGLERELVERMVGELTAITARSSSDAT